MGQELFVQKDELEDFFFYCLLKDMKVETTELEFLGS